MLEMSSRLRILLRSSVVVVVGIVVVVVGAAVVVVVGAVVVVVGAAVVVVDTGTVVVVDAGGAELSGLVSIPCAIATCLTAEGCKAMPRPAGRSGWVNTRATS